MKEEKVKGRLKGTWSKLKNKVGKVGENVGQKGPFKALQKDAELGRTLHSKVIAALDILVEKNPSIKELMDKSYAYAVIPAVGKASLVLGGAYGVGEAFVGDNVVGYAAVIKVDIGVQLGGTNFHQLIIFNDKETWKQFKAGKYSFSADAAVAIVKAGAQASKGFGQNTDNYIFNEGGMLLDLAIGVQKFTFKPTVLGRARSTEGAGSEGDKGQEEQSKQQRPPEEKNC